MLKANKNSSIKPSQWLQNLEHKVAPIFYASQKASNMALN